MLLFFFNDTATTEIYSLSLHDALPICLAHAAADGDHRRLDAAAGRLRQRSEEHTSELQSHSDIVCRLLLEKKKSLFPGRSRQHSGAGQPPMLDRCTRLI